MSVAFHRRTTPLAPAPILPSAVVVALALIGAGLSAELLRLHDPSPWASDPAASSWLWSLCGGADADCGEAAKSGWSEITLPYVRPTRDLTLKTGWGRVPLAFVGLAYFVSMATWFALGGWPARWRRFWRRLVGAAAIGAVVVSLLLVGLMLAGFAETCRLCLATHAVGLLLAAVALWSTWRPVASRRLCGLRQALPILATIALLVGGMWLYRAEQLAERAVVRQLLAYRNFVRDDLQQDADFLLREFDAQPVAPDALIADADSAPQLLLFTSLECRACYCFTQKLTRDILPPFDGRIRLHPRFLPRDPNVAPERAVYAASLQGGPDALWRMHAKLSARRTDFGPELYRALAAELGLDADRLLRDLDAPAVAAALAADRRLAQKLGVVGTPTVFVNGRRLTGLLQTPTFWEALAQRHLRHAPPLARHAPLTEAAP